MLSGRKLAAWFHQHHGPHLRADLGKTEAAVTEAIAAAEAAVRSYVRTALDGHLESVTALLNAHQDAMKAHISGLLGARDETIAPPQRTEIIPLEPKRKGKRP